MTTQSDNSGPLPSLKPPGGTPSIQKLVRLTLRILIARISEFYVNIKLYLHSI